MSSKSGDAARMFGFGSWQMGGLLFEPPERKILFMNFEDNLLRSLSEVCNCMMH